MTIEYVTGLQNTHAPSRMLATESDIQLLRDFVNRPGEIPAAQAAGAVVHVVQDAASASAASTHSVPAAQIVLTHLCKNPRPDALPDLLTVCEYDVSFDIVDVFKLYSAAWKVVTATCLNITDAKEIPLSTRLRVLRTAFAGIQNMLLQVAQRSKPLAHRHDNLNPLPDLTRYLKIARFHSINAARCCKAFSNFEDLGNSSEDQMVTLTAQLLRILAYVVHACNFTESIAESVRLDMIQNICPALGGIMRSVLSMIHSVCYKDDGTAATRLISKTLDALVGGEESPFGGALGITSDAIQILAIFHLLRLAASETSQDLQKGSPPSGLQNCEKSIFLCRQVLTSSLLPTLFSALETAHARLFTTRERQTGLTLLECISLLVEECTARADVEHNSPQQSTGLEDFLFIQMNAGSAVRALISHRAILGLMEAHKDNLARQLRLLFVAMTGARLSLSLGTGYAEGRWIPLASALALVLFKSERNLAVAIKAYQESKYGATSPPAACQSNSTEDAVILRTLSTLCGLLLSQGEEKSGALLSPQRIDWGTDLVKRVFQSSGLDPVEVSAVVKKIVLTEPNRGCLTEAAIYLLPYLMDGRSASEVAVVCMKREEFSIQTQHRAINILNPALMSSSALQTACTQATALIQRFGSVMCAPVAAFVARASLALHQNVSPSEWQQLSSLLELAILTFGTSIDIESSIDALREAATMDHATHALKATNSLLHNMTGKNTRATLPSSILHQVENAQARMQKLQKCRAASDRFKTAETESSCVVAEEDYGKMHQQETLDSSEQTGSLREFGLLKQQLLIYARRMSASEKKQSPRKCRTKFYIDELRDLLFVLEETSATSHCGG